MKLTSQRRHLRLTGRASIAKMSTERQRLSFFLVLIFLAVFGLIVLAEVFFVDKEVLGGKGDFLYDSAQQWSGGAAGLGLWETPGPLGRNRAAGSAPNDGRLHESLKKHEFEMEKLIKNISARIQSSVAAAAARMNIPPIRSPGADVARAPHRYDQLEFERGHGDAVWQPVNGTRHKFYVYSAFFDPRGAGRSKAGVVRVIAVTKTKNADKVWCGLRFEAGGGGGRNQSGAVVVAKASVWAIRENWNLKYSAAFVLCPLESSSPVPDAVSIFAAEDGLEGATNRMPVLNRDYAAAEGDIDPSSVGVCVKPVHFEYNKTSELVEFIELNRLLGVSRFTLYNDTMSDEVSCVLQRYYSSSRSAESARLSVLEWKLNVASQTEIRTEGLFAALNDCLYRNMLRVQYLALIDFDEFIVPKRNRTLPEMLAFIDHEKARGAIPSSGASGISRHGGVLAHSMVSARRVTSSYSFQNAFFYLQFPDDPSESKSAPRALKKTRRKAKFNPQKQRSKYICIPRNVREAGNHFIWDFQEGFSLNVPTSVGFLHHYRVCEFGGDDCVHTESVVDRTVAERYKEELTSAIDRVLKDASAAGCISEGGKRAPLS